MGTFTCQILVGQKHTHDGGILNISHTMYLSENDRPAWMLSAADSKREQFARSIVWIPTLENMLEDALLMIGLYVLKDEKLLALANEYIKDFARNRLALYNEISTEHLQHLYECSREIKGRHKIVVSVFHGSSVMGQLPALKNYENEIEVCTPIYVKEQSFRSDGFEEVGELSTFRFDRP